MNNTTEQIDEQIIFLRKEGLLQKDIASKLSVSIDKVKYVLGKAGIKNSIHTKSCLSCGVVFKTKGHHARFCSDYCRVRYNKKYSGPKRICEWCDKSFNSYTDKKHCSNTCRDSYNLKLRTQRTKAVESLKKGKSITKLINALHNLTIKIRCCSCCGKEYIFEKHNTGVKYCSEECKVKSLRRQRNESRRGFSKDKRWRVNGKVDYSISLEKLHLKDNGECYICQRPTDYNDFILTDEGYFIAGDNYPSIDHVIPVAKGGLHQWNNVKLAHRKCNYMKSDNLLETQNFTKN